MPLYPGASQELGKHLPAPSSLTFRGTNWKNGVITQAECYNSTVTVHPERLPYKSLPNGHMNTLVLRALGFSTKNVADTFGIWPSLILVYEQEVTSAMRAWSVTGAFGPTIDKCIDKGVLDVQRQDGSQAPELFDEELYTSITGLASGVSVTETAAQLGLEPDYLQGRVDSLQRTHRIGDAAGLILLGHANGALGNPQYINDGVYLS